MWTNTGHEFVTLDLRPVLARFWQARFQRDYVLDKLPVVIAVGATAVWYFISQARIMPLTT